MSAVLDQASPAAQAAHPLDGQKCRATGNHLAAQNDEPEPGDLTAAEVDAIAADLQFNQQKSERFHRGNDHRALQQQAQAQDGRGWL